MKMIKMMIIISWTYLADYFHNYFAKVKYKKTQHAIKAVSF